MKEAHQNYLEVVFRRWLHPSFLSDWKHSTLNCDMSNSVKKTIVFRCFFMLYPGVPRCSSHGHGHCICHLNFEHCRQDSTFFLEFHYEHKQSEACRQDYEQPLRHGIFTHGCAGTPGRTYCGNAVYVSLGAWLLALPLLCR